MTRIQTPNAAPPGGHYSQAIVHEKTAYLAGILPILPDGTKLTDASITAQTKAVLANLRAILAAAGSSPDQVIHVRIYLTDIAEWGIINTLYADFFGDHKPARAVVPVPVLHYGFKLELEAVAGV
ncbi:RidA family protein [Fibrella sp. HMF5335]|uniref:RidA family protein n=1 Tax=Fibrella rubiginis TaxID=2817060 RepID=A0A939K603_9BACT|nr:RidA family protein [Fibrella rubiginis]MBO0940044.1 RidA family protein [Fibrella rubiginis]